MTKKKTHDGYTGPTIYTWGSSGGPVACNFSTKHFDCPRRSIVAYEQSDQGGWFLVAFRCMGMAENVSEAEAVSVLAEIA